MKKKSLWIKVAGPSLLALLLSSCSKDGNEGGITQPVLPGLTPPVASLGFATLGDGTTGGAVGQIVEATDFASLRSFLESTQPLVVTLNRRIYNGEKGGSIRVASNKTLVGIGANAFLDGVGLSIIGQRNVVVRNVTITLNSVTNRDDPAVYSPTGDEGRPQILVNGGDLIRIQNSINIWVDHCTFYNEDPQSQTNQDLYDGCIDITGNSALITISWNIFRDAHKTSLIGSSDSDNFDRRITYHHNLFSNIGQRVPSYRFGTGHVVNNYFVNIRSTGINTRMGACLRVENNVFENARSPLVTSGTPTGNFDMLGNSFTGTTGIAPPSTGTCTSTIPYTFVADAVQEVKQKVQNGAGAGKL